jgi:hypothetical protein
MDDEYCEPSRHEWERGHLTDGRPIDQCTRCPRWKLSVFRPFFHRDPENTRRSMEETSRALGEHRDV